MKTKSMKISVICLLVVSATLIHLFCPIFAFDKPVYIKEIVTSTASNASEAKKKLTNNGYTVLEGDLNAGTDENPVYLGYKTTYKKSEAITDISLMDMEGGYEMMDYASFAAQNQANIAEMTSELKNACSEMRQKLYSGSEAARTALDYLNIFTVPEANMPLGDYLLDEKRTDGEYRMLLLVCNSLVINIIYTELSLAITDYGENNKNWVERISDICGDEAFLGDYTENRDELYDLYYRDSLDLYKILAAFNKEYISANERKSENGGSISVIEATEEDARDAIEAFAKSGESADESADDVFVLSVVDYLNTFDYSFAEKYFSENESEKLGDVLMKIASADERDNDFEDKISLLYPLVKALTPAQKSLLCVEGLTTFMKLTLIDGESLERLNEDLPSYRDMLYEALESDSASVWIGTNRDIYGSKIALTTEARRNASAANDYEKITYVSEFDTNIKVALCYIGGAAAASAGVTLIALGIGGIVFKGAATAIVAGMLTMGGAISATVSGVAFGCVGVIGLAVSAVVIAALVVCAIVYAVDCLIDLYHYYNPEYTEIPSVMVDVRESGYVTYRAVTDCGGKNSDINIWEGKKWSALYYTKDSSLGTALTVNESGVAFKAVYGSTKVPDGMTPITHFGEKTAVNFNAHTYDDDVNGIFVYCFVEKSGEGADTASDGAVYLESMTMLCNESDRAVKDLLKIKGYKILDFNLTSDTDYATFIGYTTTTNPANAITDIRVSYAGSEAKYYYGDMTDTYGFAGSNSQTTENEATELFTALYYTKSKKRGTPIYENLFVSKSSTVPIGYEPVNLFSGGGAFDFNVYAEESPSDWKNHAYVFFEPSEKYYAENSEAYLGGINFVSGSTDMDYGRLEDYASELGMTVCKTDLTRGFYNDEDRTWLCYSTTYNPYRAIYDIGVYTCEYKSQSMPENIVLDGVGYVACQTFTQGDRSYYGNILWGGNYRIIRPTHAYISNNEDYGGDDEYGDTLVCNRGMFVCGPESGKNPIKMSDFNISTKSEIPSGHIAVHDMTDKFAASALNLALYDSEHKNALYITYPGTAPVKQKYISKISVIKSTAEDISYDKTMYKLMSMGGDEIIKINLSEKSEDSWQNRSFAAGFDEDTDLDDYNDSVAYIRITRTKVKNDAIGSVVIVQSDSSPASTMTLVYDIVTGKTAQFTNAGDGISWCGGKKFYICYSTSGSGKISDFTVDGKYIVSGKSTVLNNNKKLVTDIGHYFHTYSDTALQYYSLVSVASGENELDCVKSLLSKGCTEVQKISQSGKTIMLGYAKTSSQLNAVKNIVFAKATDDSITKDGVSYTKCGSFGGISLYSTMAGDKTKAITNIAYGKDIPNKADYPSGTVFEYVQLSDGEKGNIATALGASGEFYVYVSHKDGGIYGTMGYYASVVFGDVTLIYIAVLVGILCAGGGVAIIIKKRRERADRT